ncbi:ABC transporter permease subunit [Clostridium sp. P21]|uniref:ABC transporter permease subunit n=1 Tax=Clostridium muellerianum TaxID=2716538 RepID=A0A7Y0EMF8_9CLOT|nr:ABC transporter permease subunit [Clostridium muellerianum]NMM65802.1 ABC transporter permease subunit [Clostridium muellerianum]
MSKYIWEELKRVIIKKKISIIIIVMITIAFGIINISKTKTLEANLQGDKALLDIQKSGRDKAKTEFKKAEFSRDIAGNEKQIAAIEEQLNTINNYDKSKLDEQIQKLEKENNPKNEYKIIQLKYEKEHNIEKSELTPRGTYRTIEILMGFIPMIFLLIMIVLLSDIVSGEYAPNTIKILLTKSIPRKRIIISKFIVSIILSASTMVISAIIFILEAGIHLGFSDYRLPFDVGAKYVFDKSLPLTSLTSQMKYVPGSRTIIPLWSSIIILVLITIIVSIAIISIIMFISTVCKNSLISALTNFILICGTAIWYVLEFAGRNLVSAKYGVLVKFFPIPYIINGIEILTGVISQQLTSSVNILFILMVCFGWTLTMMFLSTYIFGKRDFD